MNKPDIAFDSPASSEAATTRYRHLMRHIERIDLLLQQRFYQRELSHQSAGFMLPEEEVAIRLAEPTGAPEWAGQYLAASALAPASTPQTAGDTFAELAAQFELTAFERDVLLLGLLPHFDGRYHALFGSVRGDRQRKYPAAELALQLFSTSSLEMNALRACFLPQATLFRHRLLMELDSEPVRTRSWGDKSFVAAPEVFHHLLGNRLFSMALTQCLEILTTESASLGTPGLSAFTSGLRDLLELPRKDIRPVVMLRGREGSGRAQAVAQAAFAASCEAIELDASRLPEDDAEAEDISGQLFRYARMRGAYVVLRNLGALSGSRPAFLKGLARQLLQPGLAVVCLAEPHSQITWFGNVPQFLVDMPVRSTQQKVELLNEHLAGHEPADLDAVALSRCFDFTADMMSSVIQEAAFYGAQRNPDEKFTQQDLRKALRLRSQQDFGKLAQRIEPRRKIEDLIVSDELAQQLAEITVALKYRESALNSGFADKVAYGTGISALFYGPSGTGKTMAAEVLAASQGVDLVKVDLSTVVNKYIGETEKNLSRIFDLAEADAGVLFFDEADALFGKRSESKDAQDRHANIEVAYLLQRLENYPGLVVLATNNRSHLDDAFSRRFTFITHFAFPDAALRERMWRAIWPDSVRLAEGMDFRALAKKANVTGANIRNVALLAMWLASADSTGQVEASHVDLALKRELAKVGRLML